MDSIPLAQNHPGGLLFASGKCVECHGANRQGTGTGEAAIPSLVNLEYKYADIEEVKKVIKNGRNAMPSNEGYSDEELTLIAQFLLNIPAVRWRLNCKVLPTRLIVSNAFSMQKDIPPRNPHGAS